MTVTDASRGHPTQRTAAGLRRIKRGVRAIA